jgi:hypothetical protein
MATWPSTLPIPLLAGYELETTDPTRRTDMESGAARVRRTNTGSPDNITLTLLLTEDEMAIFRAFWVDEWKEGAAWVYFPVKDGMAAGVANKECRPKKGSFKATPIKLTSWHVQIEIEVRNA